MELKPTSRAIVARALRASLFAIIGVLFLYVGFVSGKAIPALIGLVALALAIVRVASLLLTRIQLQDGVLSARVMLRRRRVRVSEITDVVPVSLARLQQSVPFIRGPVTHILDVVSADGSTGIWLNPKVFGADNVKALLEVIHPTPSSSTEQVTAAP